MTPNALVAEPSLPLDLPPYADLTDEDYREAVLEGMRRHLAELEAVATDPSPATVENVLHAVDLAGTVLQRSLDAFELVHSADATPAREALDAELAPLVAAHHDAVVLDRRLYERFVALRTRADAGEVALDEQDAWHLDETIRAYERGGIALGGDEQDRLRAINAEIAVLHARFAELVTAGRNAAAVLVTDPARLAGLAPDDVERAAAAARDRGQEGWLLELVNTTGQPLLASLADRGLRRELFEASTRRGLGGEHDTRAVLLRLVRLRAEKARLLGFPHYAALAAAQGCAGTTEEVLAVLHRIGPAAVANARREAQVLQEALDEVEPGATLEPWDWQYLAGIVRARDHSLDEGLLRPYLQLERVLHDGVLAAATGLYGLTFHRREDLAGYTDESWVYEVREEDGTVLGGVVVDALTRPTKHGGAWMTSIVRQSELHGTRPVVSTTCNVPRPADGPALMSWDGVITLFHEFGHALHGLLSDVRYRERSGTATPRDFVEFPSQVNEMWAWEPSLLARYAVHHETGEPIPAEWVDAILAARHAGEGYAATESYAAMLLDQAWHTASEDELPADADGVEAFEAAALAAAGVDLPLVPPRYRSTYFSHLFGGGYAAAYYSYVWSEVFDADTVAWFADNGGLTRANGERFRRQLLSRGGSVDVRETYRRFRGADPQVHHLLERHGLG